MIYVILTYIFYPFLYLVTLFKKSPFIPLYSTSHRRAWLFRRGTLKFPPLAKGGKGGFSDKSGKILIIQTAKIGDLICSTPVFREIKKKYPHVHLAVMVNPAAKELLEHNPYVNEVITINTKDYKGFPGKVKLSNIVRRGNYDIAICLNPNVLFAVATLWGLVPVRLGIMPTFCGATFKTASGLYTHLVRHESKRLVMETYMEMLKVIGITGGDLTKEVYRSPGADEKVEEFFLKTICNKIPPNPPLPKGGIEESKSFALPLPKGGIEESKSFALPLPKEGIGEANQLIPPLKKGDGGGFSDKNILLIGIAVSSGNKLKELGAEKLAVLADSLIEQLQARVILIGSENEKDTAVKILSLSKNKNAIIDSTGLFKLGELPALIEKLSLFIGVDTGITYMADALLVPVIDIAGPSDMNDQRPIGRNSIIIQKDFPCVPCSHAFNAPYSCKRVDRICITSVDVSEIVDAVKRLLQMSYNNT